MAAGVERGELPLPVFKHLGARRTRRIQHHRHNARVVRAQLARVPPLDGRVHQLFARIDPGAAPPLHGVQHVRLVRLLRLADGGDGVLRREHVPGPVRAQDETPVLANIHGIDPDVRFRAHDKDVLFAVVRPEVAEGAGHGQKGDFVDVCGAADGTFVSHFGTVPDHARDAGFADHLSTALLDSLAFLWKSKN